MSYVVLARKWRPMNFDDLVGQDHVAKTLANAIRTGRVAHAFLFTGVRGVGKTTSARILAKALNCMGDPETTPPGFDPGPTISPCLKCPACLEIAAGTDMDVREIDGASYNGVDEVRKLQDSLPYRPSRDRYKIFIVDEVHMLSQSAWNAFLKTLEEPPPHVKFIFATTEVHKVPVTILSRVQRFDFKLIAAQTIANRLRYVLEQEGVKADDRAIALIAREAAGSMRDAMSLLDQAIAWGGSELEGEAVARVLGVAGRDTLVSIAAALIEGDPARTLEVVAGLSEQGYDIPHVARDLLAVLRDLVVAKVSKDSAELLDLPAEEVKDTRALAEKADADDLIRLHQGFSQGYDEVIKSGQPRAALEMLLVRLARRPALVPIDDLIARLAAMERRLTGNSPDPGGGRGGGGGGHGRPTPEREPPQRPREFDRGAPRQRDPQTPARPASTREAAAEDEPPPWLYDDAPPSALEAPPEFEAPANFAPPPPRSRPSAPSAPQPSRPSGSPGNGAGLRPSGPAGNGAGFRPNGAPSNAPRSARSDEARPSAPAPATMPIPESPLDAWRVIVDAIGVDRPEIAAFLAHGAPLELGPGELVVGWEPGSVFLSEVSNDVALDLVSKTAERTFGAPFRVRYERDSARANGAATVARADSEAEERRIRQALGEARRHERVAEAVEILGARVKDIRLAKGR
jgi:DNA polymerase-3 subunit gamma/tau